MSEVTAVILGIMQDGGLPHAGCRCPRCTTALNDPSRIEYAACLALIDQNGRPGARSTVWLIDATPDIKYQLSWLGDQLGQHPARPHYMRQPDGIFLTHAHMGHIAGLPHLGPEAMAVRDLPLFASGQLCTLLQEQTLWQPVVTRFNLQPLVAYQPITLSAHLHITPIPVPHRDEWGVGTFAFHVQGPEKSLLYLPDIDSWEAWPEAEAQLTAVDYALVDASFYSLDELNGRPPVAHPLVGDTLQRFATIPGQLILTHFNHTNPVLLENSAARQTVMAAGANPAEMGMVLAL